MSTGSNIISAVAIVLMVLSGWFIININNMNHSLINYEETRRNYELNKAANDIGEILNITEPSLKMSIAEMMGEIAYQRDGKIKYNNQELDAEKKISELLDSIYGKENYYLELIPPKVKARMVFVIDGSRSLADDLENINKVIPAIENYLKEQEIAIETIIYILKEKGNEEVSCKKVNTSQAKCIDEGLGDFAVKFVQPSTAACNDLKPGIGLYNKYFTETLKNPQSEYYLGEDTISLNYSSGSKHYCKQANQIEIENYQRIPKGLYYEDWATGTAYVAKDIPKKQINSTEPTITLIFPISDELSTGSESDKTYSSTPKIREELNKPAEKDIKEYYDKRMYDSFCDTDLINNGRLQRADTTIKHAISVLQETDYIVMPILTNPQVKTNLKQCYEDGRFKPVHHSEDRFECCGKTYCGECDAEKGPHTAEWLIKEIRKDMQELATATKGQFIDLSQNYNEIELKTRLLDSITRIINKKFVFGTKKDKEERYSINRAIPLKGNRALTFNFWIYKNKKSHTTSKVEGFKLNPIAKAFASTYKETLKEDITITLWGNAISPTGKEVKAEWFIGETKIGEGQRIEKTFTKAETRPGKYEITLKVTDNEGNSSEDKITIELTEDKTTNTEQT
ncbi:MAG: hypothetical protein QXZ13_00865 [Candidatus Diapherotrites archaeon]